VSTLKVDTITKADGTGSLSVPAESGTVVTTASPSLGRRNLIINGAMQVAQRGTSFANGEYSVDRFYVGSVGTLAVTQDSDAPDGYNQSLKLSVSSTATPASNQANQIRHFIEGYNTSHLNYGTSSAQDVTISFWVKSSIAGQYSIALRNNDASRFRPQSYTINSTNTWEYKTITIAGDTTGTWATDNTIGLGLHFGFGAGVDRREPSGSWTSSLAFGSDGDVVLTETSGATFYLTGVQLEVGSVATPFEHRSYGEELALCQRYFHKLSRDYNNGIIGSGYFYANTTCRGFIPMPTTMRSYPSVSHGDVTDVRCGYGGGSSAASGFAGLDGATKSGVWVGYTTSSGTQGHGALLYMYPSDPEISFDAEL